MLPSPEVEPERYKCRPLLVVLENYVLAAIGEFPRIGKAASPRLYRRCLAEQRTGCPPSENNSGWANRWTIRFDRCGARIRDREVERGAVAPGSVR